MRKNPNSTLLAGPLLLLLLLASCSKHEEPAPTPAPKPAPQAKSVPKPVPPVQKQISSVTGAKAELDFRKKTDPFKPYVVAPAKTAQNQQSQQSALPAADLLPIQVFEVSKFKVAGIIAGLRENRALLIDPNGKGYVVQEGMQIGNQNGRISRITASSVEVVEQFKEGGRVRKRKIILTLAKKR